MNLLSSDLRFRKSRPSVLCGPSPAPPPACPPACAPPNCHEQFGTQRVAAGAVECQGRLFRNALPVISEFKLKLNRHLRVTWCTHTGQRYCTLASLKPRFRFERSFPEKGSLRKQDAFKRTTIIRSMAGISGKENANFACMTGTTGDYHTLHRHQLLALTILSFDSHQLEAAKSIANENRYWRDCQTVTAMVLSNLTRFQFENIK